MIAIRKLLIILICLLIPIVGSVSLFDRAAEAALEFDNNSLDISGNDIQTAYIIAEGHFASKSLVAGYPFNVMQSSEDLFGGNDGSDTNITYNSSGANFDGSTSIINTTVSSSFFTDNFTICSNFNPSNSGAVRQNDVFSNFVSGTSKGILTIIETDDRINFYSSANSLYAGTVNIGSNNFYCIGQNSSHRWAELNGAVRVTSAAITTYDEGLPYLYIGESTSSTSREYNGTMSNLYIYNRSLSSDEVVKLYKGGNFTDDKNNSADSAIQFDLDLDKNASNAFILMSKTLNFSDKMSISLWFYPNNVGSSEYILFKEDEFAIASGNNPKIGFGEYAEFDKLESNITINAGEWIHLVAIDDNGSISLYINNELAGVGNDSALEPTSSQFTIAARWYVGDNSPLDFFSGKIDKLRFYDYALSEFEINQLYTEFDTSEGLVSCISVLGAGCGVSIDNNCAVIS